MHPSMADTGIEIYPPCTGSHPAMPSESNFISSRAGESPFSLRLEENGFIELPPRIKRNNNLKPKSFDQIPLFVKQPLSGSIGDYPKPAIRGQALKIVTFGIIWFTTTTILGCPSLLGLI